MFCKLGKNIYKFIFNTSFYLLENKFDKISKNH